MASSVSVREASSRGARRRRMPMLARMRSSGAYHRYIMVRSSSVTISRVSSSWLRRNVPHWPCAGIAGVRSSTQRMAVADP